MEPEGSLPHSQAPATCPYPEPAQSFRSHYDPGVDSASNRNEYQGHFLAVKAAGA
jgi:hypothetical protein